MRKKSQLYKPKDSPYFYYDFTDARTGKRARGSTKEKTQYKAQLVLDEKKQTAQASGVEALTRKAPTLEAFSKTFLEWVEKTNSLENSTKKFYRHGWDLLSVTPLAGMKLDAIRGVDCDTCAFPGGPWHANQALRTLRRILSLARKEYRVLFGEQQAVPLRDEERRTAALNLTDATALAAKMPDGNARDAFLLLRGTGMRPGEALAARWEYVSWETRQYQNPRGKTKSARRAVPLLHDSFSVLSRRHVAQGQPREGWIFPSNSQTGHMETIAKTYTRARIAAGLPAMYVLYSSRHGALTDLARIVPLSEVMKIGGHTSTATAIGYQHSETPHLQELLDTMQTTDRIQ